MHYPDISSSSRPFVSRTIFCTNEVRNHCTHRIETVRTSKAGAGRQKRHRGDIESSANPVRVERRLQTIHGPVDDAAVDRSGAVLASVKLRRESTDLEDMFFAHIGGMDSFARGLLIADRVLADPRMSEMHLARYASFDNGDGKCFEDGELNLSALRDIAAAAGEPEQLSGKQELVENLINDYIVSTF